MLSVTAGVVLSFAILLLLVRFSLPAMSNYQQQVEEILGGYLSALVQIDTLKARWHGWKLVLSADGIQVQTIMSHQAHIDLLDIELALLPLLLDRRQLRIDKMLIRGAEIHLHGDGTLADGGNVLATLSYLPLDLSVHNSRITYTTNTGMNVSLVVPRLRFKHTGSHSHLQAYVHPPGQLRQIMRLDLQWPEDLATLSARFSGDEINLPLWLHELELVLPDTWPRPGAAPVRLAGELHWEQGQLQDARLYATGDFLLHSSTVSGSHGTVDLPGTRLLLAAKTMPDGARFLGGYLRVAALSPMARVPETSMANEFRLAWPTDEGRPVLQLERFDLGLLRRLWVLAPPSLPLLPAANGYLQYATLWLGEDYAGRLTFERTNLIDQAGPIKRLQGLSGLLEFNALAGYAELKAASLRATVPRPYGYEIELSSLAGRVGWRWEDNGNVLLSIESLQAIPPGAGGALLKGNVHWQRNFKPTWLALTLSIDNADHDALLTILPAKPRKQAESILLAANFPRIKLEWTGPPSFTPEGDIPQPQFLAMAEFERAIYAPAEGKPLLRNAKGHLKVHQQALEMVVDTADWHGLALTDARVTIPDVRVADNYDFTLSLAGDVEPFHQLSNHWLPWMDAPWQLDGDMTLELSAAVRAQNDDNGRLDHLQGILRFKEVSLLNQELNVALYELEGTIQLSQDQLSGTDIRGNYRDNPIHLDIQYSNAVSEVAIGVVLETAARDLHQEIARHTKNHPKLHEALKRALSGHARWEGIISERADKAWEMELRSELDGLAIELPEPFGKAAEEEVPFRFTALLRPHQTWIELDYRGQMLTGILSKNDTPATLLWQGDVSRVSVEEWRAWLPASSDTPLQAPRGLNLDLNFEALSWHGHDYALALHAKDTPHTWLAEFDGEHIQGLVRVPHSTDPTWEVFLERFVYAPKEKSPPESPPKRQAISVQMRVAVDEMRFDWDPDSVWQLRLASKRMPSGGLDYDVLSLSGNGLEITGTGTWQPGSTDADTGGTTAVDLTLTVDELGTFFRLVGEASKNISGAPGALFLNARWPGGLDDFSLASLEGELRLDFGEGSLQKISTGGTWMLGLFSLQTPLNILTLNPLKPLRKGLSFNRLYGEFHIQDSYAHAQEITMEGDSLELTITGSSGLKSRDYDQEVTVVPDLYDSLALPGIIFGPIGLGAGYAISILGRAIDGLPERINQVVRKRYRITGTWDEPIVEPLYDAPSVDQAQIELQNP